ncbi:MAG: V-type ATP synthase subunit D [Candidatus Omnitrophota bacterium]
MSKIKLTKGELKRQRDALEQFQHYLPTLQLKKQQLQIKILEMRRTLKEKEDLLASLENGLNDWVGLLADPGIDIKKWVIPEQVILGQVNIAGASIPLYREVIFKDIDYDYYEMPLWVDRGVEELRELMQMLCEIEVIKKQISILQHELKITTQRVNLFEKVRIPECIENIRIIRIYLGDRMANAVGISKVAKKKIEQSTLQEALA